MNCLLDNEDCVSAEGEVYVQLLPKHCQDAPQFSSTGGSLAAQVVSRCVVANEIFMEFGEGGQQQLPSAYSIAWHGSSPGQRLAHDPCPNLRCMSAWWCVPEKIHLLQT